MQMEVLLPRLQVILDLRQAVGMEDRLLDALTFLAHIVVKTAEDVLRQEEDRREVDDGDQCHADIAQAPHQVQARCCPEHHHHARGCHTKQLQGSLVRRQKPYVRLAIIVVADDARN